MRSIPSFVLPALVALSVLLFGFEPSLAKDNCDDCAAPAGGLDESIAAPADISVPWPRWRLEASAKPRSQKRAERARASIASEHRLILQVNSNDAAAMNLALNNATNVAEYYKSKGDKVKIEIVTFGPGLHMLRNDTSPVKGRIEEMSRGMPELSFKACGNTRDKMSKAEDKEIPIVAQAKIVESGVVRVMQLQEDGWSYVKP